MLLMSIFMLKGSRWASGTVESHSLRLGVVRIVSRHRF